MDYVAHVGKVRFVMRLIFRKFINANVDVLIITNLFLSVLLFCNELFM